MWRKKVRAKLQSQKIDIGKSKHTGVRNCTNKEIIYCNIHDRIFYWNDYNRDKNSRRKNYKFNIGHRGKQQRYNKNIRQDYSKYVKIFQQAANIKIMNQRKFEIYLWKFLDFLINLQTLSRETVIVLKTYDNDMMNYILVDNPSKYRWVIMTIKLEITKINKKLQKFHKL